MGKVDALVLEALKKAPLMADLSGRSPRAKTVRLMSSGEIAARVFGHPQPTESEQSNVSRSLRRLAGLGLAGCDRWRRWGLTAAIEKELRAVRRR